MSEPLYVIRYRWGLGTTIHTWASLLRAIRHHRELMPRNWPHERRGLTVERYEP